MEGTILIVLEFTLVGMYQHDRLPGSDRMFSLKNICLPDPPIILYLLDSLIMFEESAKRGGTMKQ